MFLQAMAALPLLVPVVPQSSLARFGLDEARKDYSDTVGWPQLVGQVAQVYDQLSPEERPRTAIVAGNYGEAGAIDLYGPALGLPAAVSPHLTFWYWKPAHVNADTIVAVGVDESDARRFFADVTRVGSVQPVDGVRNEEVGRAILVCRAPVVPLDEIWREARRFY